MDVYLKMLPDLGNFKLHNWKIFCQEIGYYHLIHVMIIALMMKIYEIFNYLYFINISSYSFFINFPFFMLLSIIFLHVKQIHKIDFD